LGFERAEFCDDAINTMIVRLGGDRIDDLGVIAHPDEGGVVPRFLQGADVAIIEPRAASEPIAGPIEGKTGEQDHIDLFGFHQSAPLTGYTDVVSAGDEVGVQICDLLGGHGLMRPIDGRYGDAFALIEGGGDEGVEGELVGEGCVGED